MHAAPSLGRRGPVDRRGEQGVSEANPVPLDNKHASVLRLDEIVGGFAIRSDRLGRSAHASAGTAPPPPSLRAVRRRTTRGRALVRSPRDLEAPAPVLLPRACSSRGPARGRSPARETGSLPMPRRAEQVPGEVAPSRHGRGSGGVGPRARAAEAPAVPGDPRATHARDRTVEARRDRPAVLGGDRHAQAAVGRRTRAPRRTRDRATGRRRSRRGRTRLGKRGEHTHEGRRDRARLGGLLVFRAEESSGEGALLYRRKCSPCRLELGLDEIRQRRVRELDLGLCRAGLQNPEAARFRRADRRRPNSRLADPGLPLDEQRRRRDRDAVEEAPDPSELDVTADDEVLDASTSPVPAAAIASWIAFRTARNPAELRVAACVRGARARPRSTHATLPGDGVKTSTRSARYTASSTSCVTWTMLTRRSPRGRARPAGRPGGRRV